MFRIYLFIFCFDMFRLSVGHYYINVADKCNDRCVEK
jgi:hypothetical protein